MIRCECKKTENPAEEPIVFATLSEEQDDVPTLTVEEGPAVTAEDVDEDILEEIIEEQLS